MDTAVDASGNSGNSTSALGGVASSDFSHEHNQNRDFDSHQLQVEPIRFKPETERNQPSASTSSTAEQTPGLYIPQQRIPSFNAVGSSSDIFAGLKASRRSGMIPHQPTATVNIHSHAASSTSGAVLPGGISPSAITNTWPSTAALYNHQLGSNPGQPSPPSSRRGSYSFAGPFSSLEGPFGSLIGPRASFSFASDLNSPVAAPGISAAPLPSELDFVVDDDSASAQTIFQIAGIPNQGNSMFYPHLSADLCSYQLGRRSSRGGEPAVEFYEPLSSIDIPYSKYVQTSVSQPSTPSASSRGRGRPAKRVGKSSPQMSLPDTSDTTRATQSSTLLSSENLEPTSSGGAAQVKVKTEKSHHNGQRRSSAVSLMLLGESYVTPAAHQQTVLGESDGKKQTLPASATGGSRIANRKKRKLTLNEDDDAVGGAGDDDDEEFSPTGLHTSAKDSDSGHSMSLHHEQDDDYSTESESAAKRRKTSAGPTPVTKKTSSAPSAATGGRSSSHWPILKMEPVILPKHQQQALDASYSGDGDGDDDEKRRHWGTGRKKIRIEFIENKLKRQITFSKRKSGMMKKIHELTTLTGTEALLVLVSETGHIYSYATPRMHSLVEDPDTNPVKTALDTSVRRS